MVSEGNTGNAPYIAPKELAERWQCGRSSVDRIARRAGMTRLCLGEGKTEWFGMCERRCTAVSCEAGIDLKVTRFCS